MGDDVWPAWATEPVEVLPPDPTWLARGEQQGHQLERDLAEWLISPVEHIGSTAVAGLAAKPVLDFQAQVADFGCIPVITQVLAPMGWHAVPAELDQRPWERFFIQALEERRCAHLHVLRAGTAQWSDRLKFRDALRSDSALAAEYTQLKTALAIIYRDDREEYTRAKAAFVAKVLTAR